jgi:hypothetical protein
VAASAQQQSDKSYEPIATKYALECVAKGGGGIVCGERCFEIGLAFLYSVGGTWVIPAHPRLVPDGK